MADAPLFIILLAVLAPPLAAAAWGHRLGRAPDEPTTAERWQAYVRAVTMVATLAVLIQAPLAGAFAPALAIITLLATVAAALPARGRVFQQSWRLPAFLAYVLRFQLALVGFWLALGFAPAVVGGAGSLRVPVALALGGLLLFGFLRHGRVLARVMGATPIDSPATTARFAEIVARSELAATPPLVLRAGAPEHGWPNAVALPGLGGNRVVVGDTLLEKLDLDERAAIFAHEIAHLEHHRGARLRRGVVAGSLLVVLAVAVPLVAATFGEPAVAIANLVWLCAVVVGYGRALALHQQQEVDADRRALALTGDPDALVRGLTKLHALAHLPRRLDLDGERAASHPSLASRVRAIREAAGLIPPPFAAEVVLASSAPGRYAVLAPEQAVFLDGVPAQGGATDDPESLRQRAGTSRAFAYRSLAELRVKVALDGGATLIAVGTAGDTVQLPLAPASVARAQAALDALDGRLAPQKRTHAQPLGRLLAMITALLALLPGLPGVVALPAWLALLRPHAVPLAAAGLMSVGAGLVGLVQALAGGPFQPALVALAGVLAGLAQLAVARALWRGEPDARWRSYRAVLALLGAMTGFFTLILLAGDEFPGVPLGAALAGFSLALVILLRHHARASARVAAAALILLAGVIAIEGAGGLGQDPLLAGEAPAPVWTPLGDKGEPRVVTLPGALDEVQLSPGGRRLFGVVPATPDFDQHESLQRFVVSDLEGKSFEVSALALAFLDDDRLLALRRAASGLVLEEIGEDGARGAWRASLPALKTPRLAVSGTRFRVVGWSQRSWVRHDGDLDGGALTSFEAPPLDAGGRMSFVPSGEPGVALSIVMRARGHRHGLLRRHRHEYDLVLEKSGAAPRRLATTRLHVTCPDLPLGTTEFICTAMKDGRAIVFSIPTDDGVAEPAPIVPRLRLVGHPAGGPRAADTLGFWFGDAQIGLIDPLDGLASPVLAPAHVEVEDLAFSAGFVGLVAHGPGATTRVIIHAR